MRVAGSIIWSTELKEHKDKQGGGKGRPSVTTYSYTASFAVALASRPILSVGRIWADGNLLRGTDGALKPSGDMRLHTGEFDQAPDPLIEAAEGADRCPAFRGTAYVVFEDLDITDFGNRLPALSFEVIADSGALSLQTMFAGLIDEVDANVPLDGIAGLSCEGPLSDVLDLLDPVFPMDCDAAGGPLTVAPERLQTQPIALAEATVSVADGDFGGADEFSRTRSPAVAAPVSIVRYYDVDRDYQAGLQRAPGRPPAGQPGVLELPVAAAAADARGFADRAARSQAGAREGISWRSAVLDPAAGPGAVVTVPGQPGQWRVQSWEWRDTGVELVLARIGTTSAAVQPSDPGRLNPPLDAAGGPTLLEAFELPWDGFGDGATPQIFAAVSSPAKGWSGAALFVDPGDGSLAPLGGSGRNRAIVGTALDVLGPASPLLFDRANQVTVQLADPDFVLQDATGRQLAQGANRALVGAELIQFGRATPLGGGQWRLDTLLRGRGGGEALVAGHASGETFVLLDDSLVQLDAAAVGTAANASIAALGRYDLTPVLSPIAARGATVQPLSPVHPSAQTMADGGLALSWIRRARGAWTWSDGVDVPLHEEAEAYDVSFGPADAPLARWSVAEPTLTLSSQALADLRAALPQGTFAVRQRGSYASSPPLELLRLS